jgi:hypothetical protein
MLIEQHIVIYNVSVSMILYGCCYQALFQYHDGIRFNIIKHDRELPLMLNQVT